MNNKNLDSTPTSPSDPPLSPCRCWGTLGGKKGLRRGHGGGKANSLQELKGSRASSPLHPKWVFNFGERVCAQGRKEEEEALAWSFIP